MAFVGIQFDETVDGTLALVHCKWLTPRKTEVFWPPYRQQDQYDKALKRGENPVEGTWEVYKIQKCFFECDDLDKAKKKIKKAEITSDLQSEDDEFNLPVKRKRTAVRKLYESDGSDEDVTVVRFQKTLPRPPRNSLNLSQTPVSGCSLSDVHLTSPAQITFNHQSIDVTASPATSSYEESRLGIKYSPAVSDATSNSGGSSNSTSFFQEKAFQEKLLNLLFHIKEQNDMLIKAINQRQSFISTDVRYKPPVSFPLKNDEEVQALENYLNEKQINVSNLSSYLASIGGRDLVSRVNNMLKRCLSNSLAIHYSFYGKRQEKKAFNNLFLKNVIIDALKIGIPEATERAIEDAIKIWLKHAPQRLKTEHKTAKS